MSTTAMPPETQTPSTALAAPLRESLPGKVFVERAHGALHVQLKTKLWGLGGFSGLFVGLSAVAFTIPTWLGVGIGLFLGLGGVAGLMWSFHRPEIIVAHGRVHAFQRFLPAALRKDLVLSTDEVVGVGTVQESIRTGDPAKPKTLHRLFFRTENKGDVEVPIMLVKNLPTAERVVALLSEQLSVPRVFVHHRSRYLKPKSPGKGKAL